MAQGAQFERDLAFSFGTSGFFLEPGHNWQSQVPTRLAILVSTRFQLAAALPTKHGVVTGRARSSRSLFFIHVRAVYVPAIGVPLPPRGFEIKHEIFHVEA